MPSISAAGQRWSRRNGWWRTGERAARLLEGIPRRSPFAPWLVDLMEDLRAVAKEGDTERAAGARLVAQREREFALALRLWSEHHTLRDD